MLCPLLAIPIFLHVGGWRSSPTLMRIGGRIPERWAQTLGWDEWAMDAKAVSQQRAVGLRTAFKAVTLALAVLMAGIALWSVGVLWSNVSVSWS